MSLAMTFTTKIYLNDGSMEVLCSDVDKQCIQLSLLEPLTNQFLVVSSAKLA